MGNGVDTRGGGDSSPVSQLGRESFLRMMEDGMAVETQYSGGLRVEV
jgi:hypothetical protein